MRVTFTADTGGFEVDEYALVCGVSGGGHSLVFQRDANDSPDDWGVHLEYGDQSNGGYECVKVCRLSLASLSVDLAKPLGRLTGVTGFDVELQFDAETKAAVADGLRQIFRGKLDLLTIS